MTAATLALVATTAGAAPTYSFAVAATTPVGAAPSQIAVSPDGTAAYVANAQSNDVSVIDTTTKTVVGSVPITGSVLWSRRLRRWCARLCADR